MENRYPHVLSPIKLGNTVFRNRIFASPVSLPDYSNLVGMTVRQKEFYATRAKGGAASVSTGDGIVHFDTGFTHPYKLKLDDRDIYPALSDMARSVAAYGAVPTVELSHGGKYANVSNLIGDMKTGRRAYGPVHEFTASGEEVFEMPEELIREIAAAYGRAAAMAKEAGFGMVLIHAGHGWLLNQFLSPASNTRTDGYGGTLEKRLRFPLMVVDAVRAAVGAGFPIEFRMSGAEFTPGGYDIDYGVEIAKAVDGLVDLIHVSAGVHDNESTFIITHPSMFREHGCNVYLAERIKKAVSTPVAAIGGLSDPAMLEEIVASGRADVVELGRGLMADPFLPRKMAEGRTDEIARCMRCFTCMEQLRHRRSMRCAINPLIGREDEPPLPKADAPKTVLVAGGGPAGMQAALAAKARGHNVILFEASDRLGGKLNCEKFIPFKQDMYGFAHTLKQRVERAGIDVRLGTALTPDAARQLKPDAIVSAVGAVPLMLKIPGADGKNVFTCLDLAQGDPTRGESVAVIGGGLVGCESAVHFAQNGKRVTVVEMLPDAARDATWPHRLALMEQLRDLGVTVLTGTTVKAVAPDGISAASADGRELFIAADCVMMAAGLRPLTAESEALRSCAPVFLTAGDCVKPGQLFAAVSGGWYAGASL